MARLTAKDIMDMKRSGKKISMITAYDYPTAYLCDKAGVEIILVGDSVGPFVLGYRDTRRVTLDDIIRHAAAVSRAVERAHVVGDMPFGTYYRPDVAVENAIKMVREAGVDSVKLEGGREVAGIVREITGAGIDVMGHIGFTPQRSTDTSVYPVRGLDADEAEDILNDAYALVDAGVYSIVLEFVASQVAQLIREEVDVPVIGIGSGPHCDGQVLVLHDVIGLRVGERPPYAAKYGDVAGEILSAVRKYVGEVKAGLFPQPSNYRSMDEPTYKEFINRVGRRKIV